VQKTTVRSRVRATAVVAAGLGAVMALSACGGGSDSGDGGGDAGTITFWLSASDAQAKGYYDLAEAFEAETGTAVEITNVPYDGYTTKLRQSAQAESLPDAANVPSLDPIWVNALQDLKDVADDADNNIDEKYVVTSEEGATAGKVLSLPSDVTASGMFINKSLWDQAGVAYPTDPESTWTWDEFLQKASQVRQATGAQYDLTFDNSPSRLRAFVYEHGGDYMQQQDDGSFATNDQTVSALEKFVAMNDDVVMPKSVWTSGADPNALFKSGQVTAYWSGVWQVADFADSITGFEWAAVPAPAQPVHASDVNAGGIVVAFDNGGAKAEAAKDFVEFMYDPANYSELVATNGFLPVETGLSPEYGFENPAATAAFELYLKEIELADPISTYFYRSQLEWGLAGKDLGTDPTKDELAKTINGEQSVQQAVDNIIAGYDQLEG